MRRKPQRPPSPVSVPERANRILNGILLVLLLVLVRVWYVGVIQHDSRLEDAQRPQTRTRIVRAQRGTIRDRFNIPLAVNRVQYNAAIVYSALRELPRRSWRDGKRTYPRKEHIEGLAALLASELGMEAARVEDLIHSKAALFPNTPFVIKEEIDEGTYYRLRMKEREWLGLHAEAVPQRTYPQGKVAADILGYMGPINRKEYRRVAAEMQDLKRYLEADEPTAPPKGIANPEEAHARLEELQERAYSIHDAVGKAGVESVCEEALHGFCGRRIYQQDIYGSYIRELEGGGDAISGQRVVLSLSSELQAYAEELLIQNEPIRDGRSHVFDRERGMHVPLKQPWIKGGAIVALDPETGDVVAMASYPRIDPNDFVQSGRNAQVRRWFETDAHVSAIWDGAEPLRRERFDALKGLIYEQEVSVGWERYLKFVLANDSPIHTSLQRFGTLGRAVALQRQPELVEGEPLSDYERLLLIDLCRLLVDEERFSDELLSAVGKQSLATYRRATQAATSIDTVVRDLARDLFHEVGFAPWRELHESEFLKEKRREEARKKTYQRPYLDYLDRQERDLFSTFWEEWRRPLTMLFLTGRCLMQHKPDAELTPYIETLGAWADELAAGAHQHLDWYPDYQLLSETLRPLSPPLVLDYLETMRSFDELTRPLLGHYRFLRGKLGQQQEKDLAAAFYPRYGYGYGRSFAYRQAAPQGSVFKVFTSYAALIQRYDKLLEEGSSLAHLNPLTMIDDVHKSREGKGWNVGFTKGGKPIPQNYKGGRLLRTHRRHAGEIDLAGALEVSSNSYFGLLVADHMESPEDLVAASAALSFGAKTGIELPGEYAGRLPHDVLTDRTGLYCFADGQHSLVVTPLQTAVALSTIANGGRVHAPRVISLLADPTSLYTREPVIQRTLRMPDAVRSMLIDGMRLCVAGERGGARPSIIRSYHDYPWIRQDYRVLHKQIVGKTGTAECVENADLNSSSIYNHIWFGSIVFEDETLQKPELVVVVYLRYGDYGREAAPLVAQIAKRWRQIKTSHRPGDTFRATG